ncbi:LBF_2804 family protein [Arsenicibacter rosenii]|uniref:Uncharacterized protein n=1 Tax=Arsenicibacter rosenii TaxID=1750698 RepID=A0A1S2VM04_9BACT|nr:hypothetical protein [Arsenicibacter rosenii]OIN58828.1 hypothetical protein BLX24_11385 [Arsenicibacter rosenii]
MSGFPPDNTTDPFDHASVRYLRQLLEVAHPADEPYVLNDTESRLIRLVTIQTTVMASLFSFCCMLGWYMPHQAFPSFFAVVEFTVLNAVVSLPMVSVLYAILLAYVLIQLVAGVNSWAVRKIMDTCMFPRAYDAQYEQHLRTLEATTRLRGMTGFFRFGLKPYLNIPRWGMTLYITVNMGWAALCLLATYGLVRLSIPFAVQEQVLFVAGAAIPAFWLSRASRQIIHETKVRVMAPLTIREFVDELYMQWAQHTDFRRLIVEVLAYSETLTRQYSYANLLLTETILHRFKLENTVTNHSLLQEMALLPKEVRCGLERLVIFGFVIDGDLSGTDRNKLGQLADNNFLTHSASQISDILHQYTDGHGLWV